jgi:hypothetical protein
VDGRRVWRAGYRGYSVLRSMISGPIGEIALCGPRLAKTAGHDAICPRLAQCVRPLANTAVTRGLEHWKLVRFIWGCSRTAYTAHPSSYHVQPCSASMPIARNAHMDLLDRRQDPSLFSSFTLFCLEEAHGVRLLSRGCCGSAGGRGRRSECRQSSPKC